MEDRSVLALHFSSEGRGFARQHGWDRNFFLLLVVFMWGGIVAGFGLDMQNHFRTYARAYAPIAHVHALAAVGWMVILTAQVLLIRVRRVDVHRKLGLAAAVTDLRSRLLGFRGVVILIQGIPDIAAAGIPLDYEVRIDWGEGRFLRVTGALKDGDLSGVPKARDECGTDLSGHGFR